MSEQLGREWAKDVLERVARQVASLRRARGWSAQDLSNRIGELGYDLPRSAIAKIESGRRGVDVPEFLVLAQALGAPPFALLVDLPSDAPTWNLPNESPKHPWDFVQWWRGDSWVFDESNLASMPVREHSAALLRWAEFERAWDRCVRLDAEWRESVWRLRDVAGDLQEIRNQGLDGAALEEWLSGQERWVKLNRQRLDEALSAMLDAHGHEIVAAGREGRAAVLGVEAGAPLLAQKRSPREATGEFVEGQIAHGND